MIALCRYLLQGGKQCEQAAIKGEFYCRHHDIGRKTMDASAENEALREPLPLLFPGDRTALQVNYFVVLQAFNEGRINAKTTNIMIRLLRACDANLNKGPLEEVELQPMPLSEPQEESFAVHPTDQESAGAAPNSQSANPARICVSASAAAPVSARNPRTSKSSPQQRNPLDLLRHSRGISGRSARR